MASSVLFLVSKNYQSRLRGPVDTKKLRVLCVSAVSFLVAAAGRAVFRSPFVGQSITPWLNILKLEVRSCIIGGQEASDEVWCRVIGDKRHCFHNGHAARGAPRPRSKVRPRQDCDAQWNGC